MIIYSSGHEVHIDDEDFALVIKAKICVCVSSVSGEKNVKCASLDYKDQSLSRLLLNAPANRWVDHRNGNRLDNRKENLRLATPSQNGGNKKPNWNKKLPKGVCARKDKFIARIVVRRKEICLGTYKTAEEAEQVYKLAAEKYFGEFALHLSRK